MITPTPETLSVRLRRRIRRSGSSDYLSESDVDDVEALELRLAEAEKWLRNYRTVAEERRAALAHDKEEK